MGTVRPKYLLYWVSGLFDFPARVSDVSSRVSLGVHGFRTFASRTSA